MSAAVTEKWIRSPDSVFWLRLAKDPLGFYVEIRLSENRQSAPLVQVLDLFNGDYAIQLRSSQDEYTITEARQVASALQLAANIAADIESYRSKFVEP